MRYFIELGYNGANFHGWQSQPNCVTVQSTLESALSLVLRKNISVTGAGRTDTGVHAHQMYAHFDYPYEIKDQKRILLSLNSLIGKDIEIYNLIKTKDECHARFDATNRTYKYFISYSKSPFLNNFYWFSPSLLDLDLMNEAASLLLRIDDFTSFAKLHSDSKTNICKVIRADWKPIMEDIEACKFIGSLNNGFVFTVSADRFLRNMVRAIVGTLVEVGKHKISIYNFKEIIEGKNRCLAGTSMPANALFLWHVSYPFLP